MLNTNQILHKGRYRVTKEFGQDSLSGLFEAYDTVNNSTVVLREYASGPGKVLTASQRDASEAVFVGSAKVLTKIQHRNLVAVKDYFTEVGNQYLVLENVAGFDLKRFVGSDQKRPTLDQAVKWALDLLGALEYLHKLSPPIIHGDICPTNIRFSDAQVAKLLAVEVQGTAPSIASAANDNDERQGDINYQPLEKYWASLDQLTQRSILRDYDERSERILLNKLDARSDLYSLAACIYHALTGVQPPAALDRASALREGKEDPLRSLSEIDPAIPAEISDVFMKALSVRREFRFYSATVMSNVLKTAVEGSSIEEEVEVLDEISPLETLPAQLQNQESETSGGDGLEERLELELSNVDERQRQLEAEQAQLEQEQKRIEERRAALEAERQKHLVEKERLEQEAKLETQRKENERRLEEQRRLEAEAAREREAAELRLAEIEADLEQRRMEAERLEHEIEEERLRAVERLTKAREEKELVVNEQRQRAEAAKAELERAQKRLEQIAKADPKGSHIEKPEVVTDVSAVDEPELEVSAVHVLGEAQPTNHLPVAQVIELSDAPDFTFHSDSTRRSSSKRLMVMGVLGAVLAVLGVAIWFISDSAKVEVPANTAVVVPEVNLPETNSNVQQSTGFQSVTPPATNEATPTGLNAVTVPAPDAQVSPVPSSSLMPEQPGTSKTTAQDQNPSSAKKRVAVAAKTQAPKKVTADDLINDN
jgi:serine/threonine protein kinase